MVVCRLCGDDIVLETQMPTVKRFEDLECWKDARKLVNLVYKLVRRAAFARDTELARQVVRSSISIMANIAEGFHRRSRVEFTRFLDYSRSSSAETLSHLYVAYDQKYITEQELEGAREQIELTWKRVNRLMTYLRTKEARHP